MITSYTTHQQREARGGNIYIYITALRSQSHPRDAVTLHTLRLYPCFWATNKMASCQLSTPLRSSSRARRTGRPRYGTRRMTRCSRKVKPRSRSSPRSSSQLRHSRQSTEHVERSVESSCAVCAYTMRRVCRECVPCRVCDAVCVRCRVCRVCDAVCAVRGPRARRARA